MKNNFLSKKTLPILIIVVFIIISAVILIFVLSKNNGAEENQSEARLTQTQGNTTQPGFDENFATTTPSDLIIGESVMVFGSKDSNGVISAERIVLGMTQEDFKNQPSQFTGGEPGQNPNATSSPNGVTANQDRFRGNPPSGLENLSPEELEKMRTARGQQNRQRLSGQMETIFGKITQKDDTSITVVSDDGNSKYILYSQTTKILKPKEVSK